MTALYMGFLRPSVVEMTVEFEGDAGIAVLCGGFLRPSVVEMTPILVGFFPPKADKC